MDTGTEPNTAVESQPAETSPQAMQPAARTHCRGRGWRIAGLLLLLLVIAYFLLLPLMVPPPEVKVHVHGTAPHEIAVDVTVTSWNGDYMLELRQPRFYVSPGSTRVAVKLESPYRAGVAKPPLVARYFTAKQTRTFHFVGKPDFASLPEKQVTIGTLDTRLVMYAAAEPALFEDMYFEYMNLTRGGVPEAKWNAMRKIFPIKQTAEWTVSAASR